MKAVLQKCSPAFLSFYIILSRHTIEDILLFLLQKPYMDSEIGIH